MKGWIKASGAGGAALVQQVLRALFAFAWQTFAERVAEAVAWPGSGAQLVQARAQVPPGHAAPAQVPPPPVTTDSQLVDVYTDDISGGLVLFMLCLCRQSP